MNQASIIFHKNALREQIDVEDVGFLCELYEEFIRQLKEAEWESVQVKTRDEVLAFAYKYAHRLKSSALAVGAQQLGICLKNLETAAYNNSPELQAIFSIFQLLTSSTQIAIAEELAVLKGTNFQ